MSIACQEPVSQDVVGAQRRRAHQDVAGQLVIRPAETADAAEILRLIDASLEEGHLLPRTLDELKARASRFLVVAAGTRLVGCAELAPLSRLVAEVRSLVVDGGYRGQGLGSSLVEDLKEWARHEGFATLCAFTHQPSHFLRLGFSIVPHPWLPEKISTDCVGCPKFRRCGQYAMALPLPDARGHVAGGRTGSVRSSSLPHDSRAMTEPTPHVLVVKS